MRALLHRIRRFAIPSRGVPLPTLSPIIAYDLWSETYGVEPNVFQGIEAKALAQVLPDLRGAVVLDLGCGRGRVSRLALDLGARRVLALDRSGAMLRAAGTALPFCRAEADALHLPAHRESFDVVISTLMMGHVTALGAALDEIAGALRAGGTLVLTDFHPCATLHGWVRSFRNPRDGREYAIEQHAHLFEEYLGHFGRLGFRLEALREPLFKGFPVAFAMRALKVG